MDLSLAQHYVAVYNMTRFATKFLIRIWLTFVEKCVLIRILSFLSGSAVVVFTQLIGNGVRADGENGKTDLCLGGVMKRHDFIVYTMVRNGFRTSLKGFDQFCKCVEHYTDDPTATIASIYKRVAEDFHCTESSVEKNLRRLFESSDASSAIGKMFGIDFVDTGNKEIVSMFSNYLSLQSEFYG